MYSCFFASCALYSWSTSIIAQESLLTSKNLACIHRAKDLFLLCRNPHARLPGMPKAWNTVNLLKTGCHIPITEKELRIMLVTNNNILIPEYLILKTGISIAEARKQSRSYNFSKSNCQKFTGNVNLFNEYIDAVTNIFTSLLNLILYICCENADREKDSRQRTYTYRKKGSGLIKGCPREIQKWNVGWRIGKTLRNISSAQKPNTPPESPEQHRAICGSPKRPHIRSAHFHHFWTGKKGSAERKLVVHWILQ